MRFHVLLKIAIGLHSLHVHLVLFLHEVIGKRRGVLAIAPLDVVRDVPLAAELRRDGLGLVVDGHHTRGWVALEDDIALAGVMAITDEHTLLDPVSPIGLDFVVEVGRDDVLLADLAAGCGVGLKTLPDCVGIGVEIMRFG